MQKFPWKKKIFSCWHLCMFTCSVHHEHVKLCWFRIDGWFSCETPIWAKKNVSKLRKSMQLVVMLRWQFYRLLRNNKEMNQILSFYKYYFYRIDFNPYHNDIKLTLWFYHSAQFFSIIIIFFVQLKFYHSLCFTRNSRKHLMDLIWSNLLWEVHNKYNHKTRREVSAKKLNFYNFTRREKKKSFHEKI